MKAAQILTASIVSLLPIYTSARNILDREYTANELKTAFGDEEIFTDLTYHIHVNVSGEIDSYYHNLVNFVDNALANKDINRYIYAIFTQQTNYTEDGLIEYLNHYDSETCKDIITQYNVNVDTSNCISNTTDQARLQRRGGWVNPHCSGDNLADTSDCCNLAYNKINPSSNLQSWNYVVGQCHYISHANGKVCSGADRQQLAENVCNWCQVNGGVSAFASSSSAHPGACMSDVGFCYA
uniref:Killer toxin zygocin n=1 Tax=Zygosaccharomyces bailii TaxID=4954 RepID=Q8NJU1_ZYGBA|nr:killer toxin zygocin precursor [Zygosaccharomyces bailii]